MAKMKKKPTRKTSRTTMRRRLDNIVRPVSKLLHGPNICVTCQIHKDDTPTKSLHWSHYISRRHIITRWDIRNCIPQCAACHQRYTDGFCGPMVKAVNRIWGEVTVDDFNLSMTDYLETIVEATPSIRGTLWDKVEFRKTLEIKFRALYNYLEEGKTPTLEQFSLMKEMGYPNCKELQTHWDNPPTQTKENTNDNQD